MTRRQLVVTHVSLLLIAIVWGATFVSVRYVLRTMSPTSVLLVRVELATICFATMLFLTRRSLPRFPAAIWRRLALIAVFGVLFHNIAITYSQHFITAGLASLIAATNPVFTAIFSALLIGEAMTHRKVLGIAIAFVGFLIVLVLGSGQASFSADNLIGVAILLGSPIGWALYTVLSKPLIGRYEPQVIAGFTTTIGGIMFLPLLFTKPGIVSGLSELNALGWFAVLTMSVLAMFVGYIFWNRGLRTLEPTQVAVYMYLSPFFGVAFAWLLLDESITAWLLLGGFTIIAGVIVTNSGRRYGAPAVSAPPAPAAISPQPADTSD